MCNCTEFPNGEPPFKVVSFPVDKAVENIKKSFPQVGIGVTGVAENDVQMHRLIGSVNGVPLDSVELVSIGLAVDATSAHRHFMGTFGGEVFDYKMSVKMASPTTVELGFTIKSPKIDLLPEISFTLDHQKRLITSTRPDILSLPKQEMADIDLVTRMVIIAQAGPALMAKGWNIKCLIACLGIVAFAALPCLVGGPAVYAICVGPAAVGCIVGCDPPAGL